MVHVHDLDGPGPEDARAVELAAPAQHLAEAQVVGAGPGQAAAAGLEAGLAGEVARRRIVDQLQLLVGPALIVGGEAVDLVRGHEERGVLHAERAEDHVLEILGEGLAGDHLDQRAADVGGQGVHPGRAGLVAQRHLAELVEELLHGVRAAGRADLEVAVDLIDRVLDADARQAAAVGEAGSVGEHVAERDGPGGGLGLHVGSLAGHPDAVVLPGGDVAADRVVELEIALLVEGHQRDRGDRLGHGIDAVDRIVGRGLAALAVHLAEGLEVGEVAVAGDADLAAGDLAV